MNKISDSRSGAQRLSDWHRSQCDGDWEHMNGIKVYTTDNPGWMVDVEIDGSTSSGLSGKGKRGDITWEVQGGSLLGYDEGSGNLEGLLTLIADILESNDQTTPNNPTA